MIRPFYAWEGISYDTWIERWVAVEAIIVFLVFLLFFSPKSCFVCITFHHLSSPAQSLITPFLQQFKLIKLKVAGNVSDI
jgi:hypothetical protein